MVPVGKDQTQHVEMARDIAQRFNHHFGETFVLPEAVIGENIATLPGIDGRKMSKSYGNVDSAVRVRERAPQADHEDQDELARAGSAEGHRATARCTTFTARSRRDAETAAVRARYAEGIGWGDMKQLLFERINSEIAPARAEYERLIANPGEVEALLQRGAEKARAVSRPFIAEIRERIGIRPLAR